MAALQVASMLDEVSFKKDWRDTITSTLNNALAGIPVSPGYRIMVTITNRNYLLESDENGRLTIRRILAPKVSKELFSAKVRVMVTADAMKMVEELGNEWTAGMIKHRYLQIQGDQAMFNNLDKELSDHIGGLQSMVEAAGPGPGVIMQGIEEHNARVEDVIRDEAWKEQLTLQVANISADEDRNPALMRISSWILYAAISDMSGNAGQTNYQAANCFLDAMSFTHRTTNNDNFMPVAVMWGAIGNLGMRLKAFGSQDFLALAANTEEVLMTPLEAQQALGFVVNGWAPEWLGIWKNTKDYNEVYMLQWHPLRHMGPPGFVSPWGKGKGGGLSLDESDLELSFHNTIIRAGNQKASEQPKQADSWLFPGRRVRTHGLVLNAELNGVLGTLVEEAEPGVWHVRLDDDHGEKLLKVKNLATLSGAPAVEKEVEHTAIKANNAKAQMVKKMLSSTISISAEKATTTVSSSPPDLCIAGTWADWMPEDLKWDAKQECHTCEVQLCGETKFGVNRGKAGSKKWAVRPKQWSMGNVAGHYQIKVFMKGRMVDKVAWDKSA